MRRPSKSAPKVRDGKVQKKNRHEYTAREGYTLTRESPGKGFKHVATKDDIRRFIDIIPDWQEHSRAIETVNLVAADSSVDGYYQIYRREGTGSINLCAWPKDLWLMLDEDYGVEHSFIFDAIGLSYSREIGGFHCRFTPYQAKAFMLVHVFMHELGHHVDRITSKNQNAILRGEPFAEKYANDRFDVVWNRYKRLFGDA